MAGEWTAARGGVWWEDQGLHLIEQTLLPAEYRVLQPRSLDEVADAIRRLAVRGAPAIGIAAAYGLVVALDEVQPTSAEEAHRVLSHAAAVLTGTRPTAVNLAWATDRVLERTGRVSHESARAFRDAVLAEARAIAEEDRELCRRIGRAGIEALGEARRILTHCNAGALATGGYGTATAPLYLLHEQGEPVSVLADETRPLLQGSRLTAWELARAGIPVAVTADGASGALMSRGMVDAVIVGADRIAANGDTANKIGTFNLALAAAYHGVPFYVAAPFSTFDPNTPEGAAIPIEERDPEEVLGFRDRRVAPAGAQALNPAFDVTPHTLISAFVTDQGVLRPPYAPAIKALLREGVS
ncbi:MAG: S-methyl-5-thioribose-1-phosphate isomerase [Clostridia bacterium]